MAVVDVLTVAISYKDFYERYILQNKPCLLSSMFTKEWPCQKKWVKNHEPNINYIQQQYGHLSAPVVDCGKKYFSSHEKCDMNINDYFEYWKKRDNKILYLKDWHLQRDSSDHFYNVPIYFSSDWLNEYWDSKNMGDDYRFVYIGVKGSWTPFHADVFRSFSWSANVCGLKRWLLYPPGEEKLLKDEFGNLPFDVTVDVNYKLQTEYIKASKPIEVLQAEGEILFVPSCWHHQVFNLEDTISINHNWVNAAGIDQMTAYLKQELLNVKKEISDCKQMDGFHEQCQLILNATAGIDLPGFYDMVICLINSRLDVLCEFKKEMPNNNELSELLSKLRISDTTQKHNKNILSISEELKHVRFDLSRLKLVLDELLCNEDLGHILSPDLLAKGRIITTQISDFL